MDDEKITENHAVDSSDANVNVDTLNDDGIQKKWYAVHTYSGFEDHVKLALEERIASSGLKKYFGDIIIPKEDVIEKNVKGGKKKVKRKFFPGYIFVNMNVNTDSWHLLKGTPKVTGFVGDQLNPMAVDESEMDKIIAQITEGIKRPKAKIEFSKGDIVKITEGPFSGFNGTIDDIKPDKSKLEVLVSIFGRATPVELDFTQVERN
ncbi:MAG: transcription termination/antitermination protein NusG [Candidatus Acidulodesulfobacterium ferriphilum]|uniref:Transcription termination/antitermination protein NusG n=1 Tax=Candidatus Acidulodesulfobacterium ferriphilum TaxID=2597223 RepID=A0A519BE52_9DELT|nr:MAG: transcription termination/antitermination protein NusG [Candidatus Acidulodesulfobacterium ferriphilum]